LRVLFGLDKEATAEAIVAEVHSLLLGENSASGQVGATLTEKTFATTGGGSSDPARYVPVAQFESALTELNRLRAARARERAELRVDAAMRGGRIVPAQREWAIAYCQANQHGFDDFVARQPVVLSNLGGSFEGEPSETRRWVDDRETVNVEKGRTNSTLSRTELAVCAQLGLRPQEYLRRRGARDDIQMGNSN
jgi:phage I-like protein